MLTGQQWADKLVANASAAKFSQGVQNTTVDPASLAIQQQSALLANFTDAVTSGRWAANLQAAAATWKPNTLAKASNYTTGLNAAKAKLAAVGTALMANAAAISQQVQAMPKGVKGGAEGLARFDAARQAMIQFKRSGRIR